MIKKEYIQPEVKEIKIQLSHLMTMSDSETGTKINPDDETSDMDSFEVGFSEE